MTIERASGLLLHVTSLPGRFGCGTMGRAAERVHLLPGRQRPILLAGAAPGSGLFPLEFFPLFVAVGLRRQRDADRPGSAARAGLAQRCRAARPGRRRAPATFATSRTAAAATAAWLDAAARAVLRPGRRRRFRRLQPLLRRTGRLAGRLRPVPGPGRPFRHLLSGPPGPATFPAATPPPSPAGGTSSGPHPQAAIRAIRLFRAMARPEASGQRPAACASSATSRSTSTSRAPTPGPGPDIFQIDREGPACPRSPACPRLFQLDRAALGQPALSLAGGRGGAIRRPWPGGRPASATCCGWSTCCASTTSAASTRIWAIPASEPTAVKGRGCRDRGWHFFEPLRMGLGNLDLIAEDLGELTPGVETLRDGLGFPGMKILQFAFDGHARPNPYLPHNYANANCLVYTGTHDNNTSNGWFYGPETERSGETLHPGLHEPRPPRRVPLAVHPPGHAVGGPAGRHPRPGPPGLRRAVPHEHAGPGEGNWRWRLAPGALTPEIARRLLHLTGLYNRRPPA